MEARRAGHRGWSLARTPACVQGLASETPPPCRWVQRALSSKEEQLRAQKASVVLAYLTGLLEGFGSGPSSGSQDVEHMS